MAEHPYMPFFPNDFLADTAHVPGDVAGFYVILLAHAWARGGSLPDDDDQLRLMTRCHPRRWPQIREMVRSFWFVGDDGRLHQKRMDKEWARTKESRNVASNAVSRLRHRGKKPNDPMCAPARVFHTHTHTYKEKEQQASPAAARALTRATPSVKNSSGRGGSNGANRKPSVAELARRKIEDREQREREDRGEGSVRHLQLVQKV